MTETPRRRSQSSKWAAIDADFGVGVASDEPRPLLRGGGASYQRRRGGGTRQSRRSGDARMASAGAERPNNIDHHKSVASYMP